ncbi:MAG: hypothetical protein HUK26_01935, partial [Duodenibacillus sp.]|nr:hypothetical protein [Duodenibacillus sp.]
MVENWNKVSIVREFSDQGVDCYKLVGGDYLNEYYIISEAETRKLMNHPEVVGYEVYNSLVTSTSQMLFYLKEHHRLTSANVLSILRGALNFPLEQSCFKEHIRVHDISFMSSERVFDENGKMSTLVIKYHKLTMEPNSTLLIGYIL